MVGIPAEGDMTRLQQRLVARGVEFTDVSWQCGSCRRGGGPCMSGPKGGRYTVVSAEELERRAIAAATDRYSRVCGELDAVAQSLAGYGVDVPAAPRAVPGGSSTVQTAAAQLQAQLPQLRAQLTEQRVAAALAAMPKITLALSAAAEPTGTGIAGSTKKTYATKAARDAAATGAAAEEVVATAEKMVAGALVGTGSDVPAVLARKLVGIRSATSIDQQRLALDDLRFAVQRVRDQQRGALTNAKEREAVLAELDGCKGIEAQRLRSAVEDLVPGDDVPVAVAEAKQVARADAAARDALFVQAAVVDVLADLGYRVDESMAVAVAEAGVLVELPGHRDHIARVQTREGQLRFSVVRVGESAVGSDALTAAQDTGAEVEACEVFDSLHVGLAAVGVAWRLDRKDPPGATKVARARSRPATVAQMGRSTAAPGSQRDAEQELEDELDLDRERER